jgi:hypothetical protein
MPNLRKANNSVKNHTLPIPDEIVRWAGWDEGPYCDEGTKVGDIIKDKNGKSIDRSYKSESPPFINIEQRTITNYELIKQMQSVDPKWIPSGDNGGFEKTLILRWNK